MSASFSELQLWAFPAENESSLNSNSRSQSQQSKEDDDDEHFRRELRRYRAAFYKCCSCCPCSCPVMAGILLGSLIAGIVLATVLSLYLVDSKKTTNAMVSAISITTGTTVTTTSVTTTSATTATSSTSVTTTSTRTTSTSSSSSTTSTATTTTSTATTTTSITTSTSSVTTTSTATTTTSTVTTTSSITTLTTSTATTTTTTAPYCTTLVTFDDIPGQSGSSGVVPNGYKNLNWTNVEYINASSMPILSGYDYGINSAPYLAHNPAQNMVIIRTANGTRFSFDSVVVTAAWRDGLLWTIYGGRSGSIVLAGTMPMQVANRTTVSCGGCSNLDTLYFFSGNGTERAGLPQNGTQFVFDDLCISFGY